MFTLSAVDSLVVVGTGVCGLTVNIEKRTAEPCRVTPVTTVIFITDCKRKEKWWFVVDVNLA